MARLSGTVSRYQDRECADTHRSSDLHISHSRGRPGTQLEYGESDNASQLDLDRLPSPGFHHFYFISRKITFYIPITVLDIKKYLYHFPMFRNKCLPGAA